jgi:hypothetical protein
MPPTPWHRSPPSYGEVGENRRENSYHSTARGRRKIPLSPRSRGAAETGAVAKGCTSRRCRLQSGVGSGEVAERRRFASGNQRSFFLRKSKRYYLARPLDPSLVQRQGHRAVQSVSELSEESRELVIARRWTTSIVAAARTARPRPRRGCRLQGFRQICLTRRCVPGNQRSSFLRNLTRHDLSLPNCMGPCSTAESPGDACKA